LALSVSWDGFVLLSSINRGLMGLSPAELRLAAESLGNYGYQREVFEAELLRRFSEPLFFLPLAVFAIVIGWRYRALKRPRYMGIPMLGILPLVFNGAEYFSRGWINDLGIWAVVSVGFTTAAVFFGIGVFVLLVISLITLAAQHG
jgi:lipopolysaccharide export LptBFGC system permease protein LptF